MTARFHRGLLPLLFAVVAMMFSVHHANAVEHCQPECIGMVERGDANASLDGHAIHQTGCCATVAAMPDVSSASFHIGPNGRFQLHAADLAPSLHLRSEHYRPPRRV